MRKEEILPVCRLEAEMAATAASGMDSFREKWLRLGLLTLLLCDSDFAAIGERINVIGGDLQDPMNDLQDSLTEFMAFAEDFIVLGGHITWAIHTVVVVVVTSVIGTGVVHLWRWNIIKSKSNHLIMITQATLAIQSKAIITSG